MTSKSAQLRQQVVNDTATSLVVSLAEQEAEKPLFISTAIWLEADYYKKVKWSVVEEVSRLVGECFGRDFHFGIETSMTSLRGMSGKVNNYAVLTLRVFKK